MTFQIIYLALLINPFPFEWVLRALIDFTLSNARRFYSSMGNLLDGKGLTTSKTISPLTLNPFPFEWVLRALIDFTLSNARRFYSLMRNLLDGKGLKSTVYRAASVLRWFLRKKKNYRLTFLKLYLNVLHQALFKKKTIKRIDRSPFSLKRYDGPILPHLCLFSC